MTPEVVYALLKKKILDYGSPLMAATAAAMTDQNRVYVYTGSETGYTNGDWYYYDGTAWEDGGVYNSAAITVDSALSTTSEKPVQNKAVAAAVNQINSDISDISDKLLSAFPTATVSGSVASFDDGANLPVKDLTVEIEPVQSGSGDPSPSNVRPITGWTGATVTACGKNLANDNFSDYTKPVDYYIFPIKLEVGKTYTFSATLTGTAVSGTVVGVAKKGTQYSDFGSFFSLVSASGGANTYTTTITSDYTSPKMIVYAKSETIFNSLFENYEIQVEEGSTATTYEAYNGTTYTVDWTDEAGTVYGGTLDLTTGVLTVTHALVDMGTLNWDYYAYISGYSGGYTDSLASLMEKPTDGTVEADAKCSALTILPDAYFASQSTGINFTITILGRVKVSIPDTSITTASALKSYLSGMILCYPLASTTTVTLTATEIETLLGDNTIYADCGDTTITYRADPTLYINNVIASLS